MRLPNTIETVTGLSFNYTDPWVAAGDVAHGLSMVCRFGGHTVRFYSVAEHSVLVAEIVRRIAPRLTRAALWHDAHEAYLGDLPTPLKAMVGAEYRKVAEAIDAEVAGLIGLEDYTLLRHPAIKLADELAVMYEASILKPGPGWEFTRCMAHPQAEAATRDACLGSLGLSPHAARDAFIELDSQLEFA